MHADLTKVRQSLFNLLSNAAKFTHEGNITLEAGRQCMDDSEWICFRVSDTGIGMTTEQMVKLFQTSPRPMLRPRGSSAAPAWDWP